MEEVNKKLENLANRLLYINGGYIIENGRYVKLSEHANTHNVLIETLDLALDTTDYFLNMENVSSDDYQILANLVKESIQKAGASERSEEEKKKFRSYKIDRRASKTKILREKLQEIPYVEKEVEINNLNDFIKSLRIFIPYGQFLKEEYYETSYQLYLDLRKILLSRKLSAFQILYTDRIATKINVESKEMLPTNYLNEDFELSQIINRIETDEGFRKRVKSTKRQAAIIDKIISSEYDSKIKLLLKNKY